MLGMHLGESRLESPCSGPVETLDFFLDLLDRSPSLHHDVGGVSLLNDPVESTDSRLPRRLNGRNFLCCSGLDSLGLSERVGL
jgi:hypothetical protein